MKALFPASANALYWLAIGALGLGVLAVPTFFILWARTPYATGQGEPIVQPVKFDHRHHVRDDGIDCLYCHSDARRSPYAGIPATSVCMGCHTQIWTDSPELALVRESALTGTPITWQRVNNLPQHVFFDHSIHVSKGVGCESCHGRVDEMAMVHQDQPLSMGWCLDCHRDPAKHILPRENASSARIAGLHPTTECSGCHR